MVEVTKLVTFNGKNHISRECMFSYVINHFFYCKNEAHIISSTIYNYYNDDHFIWYAHIPFSIYSQLFLTLISIQKK